MKKRYLQAAIKIYLQSPSPTYTEDQKIVDRIKKIAKMLEDEK